MLCRLGKDNKKGLSGAVVVGVISLVFGIFFVRSLSDGQSNLQMLGGMFSGTGAGIIAVAIFFWVRSKVLSPEKLKEKEIEKKDERNVQITRAAFTVVAMTSNLTCAVMAYVMVGMGNVTLALIMMGSVYLELAIFLISYRIISRKM